MDPIGTSGFFGVSPGEWIVVLTFMGSLVGQWYLLGFRTKLIEKWIDKHELESTARMISVHNLELIARGQEERLRLLENLTQTMVARINR